MIKKGSVNIKKIAHASFVNNKNDLLFYVFFFSNYLKGQDVLLKSFEYETKANVSFIDPRKGRIDVNELLESFDCPRER